MNEAAPTAAPPKRRNRLKALLLLALVFVLGLVSGVGLTSVIAIKRLQASLRNPVAAAGAANRFIDRVEKDLTKHLDLSSSEEAIVREELQASRGKLLEIRTGLHRDLRSLAQESVERIAKRLPEEKRQALRDHVQERLRPWEGRDN